jgi:hypothetical protein
MSQQIVVDGEQFGPQWCSTPYNPTVLDLAPGTRLGVYEVVAQIGEGGMGQV